MHSESRDTRGLKSQMKRSSGINNLRKIMDAWWLQKFMMLFLLSLMNEVFLEVSNVAEQWWTNQYQRYVAILLFFRYTYSHITPFVNIPQFRTSRSYMSFPLTMIANNFPSSTLIWPISLLIRYVEMRRFVGIQKIFRPRSGKNIIPFVFSEIYLIFLHFKFSYNIIHGRNLWPMKQCNFDPSNSGLRPMKNL